MVCRPQHHFQMLAVCSQNLACLLACLPAYTQALTHARTHTNTFCSQQHGTLHVCVYTQTQVSYRRFLFNPSFARARQNLSACLLNPFTATELFPEDNDEAVRVLLCPRLNSLSPSSIVTTTNQLQETPAGNPCRKTPRAENSSMLHTEEVLTQPRLLQHGGNAKHTHDRLPMDSLTRLFGSPEQKEACAGGTESGKTSPCALHSRDAKHARQNAARGTRG